MDPEKQASQDDEQQSDGSSSNNFPGQDKNFNNRVGQSVQSLVNKGSKNTAKNTGKTGKMAKINRGIQAAKRGTQAIQATKQALENPVTTIFNILFSPLEFPPGANPFSVKDISSTPKFVVKIIRTTTTLITYLIPFIKIIAVIAFIGFVLHLVGVLGANTSSNQQLTASGPVFAKIGDKLNYTITVNYPGATKDIIITDKIPEGTKFVDAPQGTYDYKTNTVTWNLSSISSSASATINKTLSLTVLVTKDNDYIINTPKGSIPGGVLGESDSMVTPTLFQTAPNEVLEENNSQPLTPRSLGGMGSTPNATPTIFQSAPTNIPVSPQDTNVIKSCVVTKIGEPVVTPSLPPECTTF